MPHYSIEKMVSKKPVHLHSIEVALQGGPVPPRFISIKWGGTSAPPEFTGGFLELGPVASIMLIWSNLISTFDVCSDVLLFFFSSAPF